MERPAFLDQKPPAGYIPGIGRGATGFSTRGENKNSKVPRRLADNKLKGNRFKKNDRKPSELTSDNQEAENIYSAIDSKLANRNKVAKPLDNGMNVPNQFADLKRSLATVTEDQWLNIPEAGDITRSNKRQRIEEQQLRKTYAAPDTLISNQLNLSKLTEEREKLLGKRLDSTILENKIVEEVSATQTYLQELDRLAIVNNVEGEDNLKKMRLILQSYRKSDPKKPEGWIASARLEEKSRKIKIAQNIIEQGCENCPRSEDVWLESIRLNAIDNHVCKVLVAKGIKFIPNSLQLWLKAAELESEIFNKQRVIRKAIQELPSKEELWKLIVGFESNTEEVLKILKKAVEFVPKSIDLWTALIKLQNSVDAKLSLGTVRKILPNEPLVWILTIYTEEKFNSECTINDLVGILEGGIKELNNNGIEMPLSQWLYEAHLLEKEWKATKSSESLIIAALGSQNSDLVTPQMLDMVISMEDCISKVVVYKTLLKFNPAKFSLWKLLKNTCEKVGQLDQLYITFETLLFENDEDNSIIKQHPILPLMYSKEVWKFGGDIEKAKNIIERTLKILPTNVEIWLAKIKLLCQSSEFEQVEDTFHEAMELLKLSSNSNLERLYYKYISFLRYRFDNKKAIELLETEYLDKFSTCNKLYLQWGQIYCDIGEYKKCQESFSIGTKKLPNSSLLWISLARLYENILNKPIKARSTLDIAIIKNPNQELLYLEKAQLEKRLRNESQATLLVSQGLQKFPKSSSLWVEKIRLLNTKKCSFKKTIFQDALKATSNSYQVLLEIGLSFYRERQYSTSLKWLERATKGNSQYGDSWLWLARCNQKLNQPIDHCLTQVKECEPTHGPEWVTISKGVNTQYLDSQSILNKLIQ